MDPTKRYERGLAELQKFTASLREPSARAKVIAMTRAWKQRHGVWTRAAWTVRVDVNPRTGIELFELFDSCRYVRTFPSAQAAKTYADVYELSANDNRRTA